MTQKILFLCTGNACRSQMAEGWMRYLSEGRYVADSAGLEAHGKNPRAIQVMSEAGVDISNQASTKITDENVNCADVIITVCGHADEHCPTVSANTKKIHMPFDDPAKATGNEDEILGEFRRVRDEIRQSIVHLIANLDQQLES